MKTLLKEIIIIIVNETTKAKRTEALESAAMQPTEIASLIMSRS